MSKKLTTHCFIYCHHLMPGLNCDAPGLEHYASTGQEQLLIVDELYTKVLNKL